MPTALDDAFMCPTCLDIFIDPCTVVPCGHSVCRHCLEHWLERGNTRCPSCTATISHACLSFALRDATESVHREAVSRRRDALGLSAPAHFSRSIASPHSIRRVTEVILHEGGPWFLMSASCGPCVVGICYYFLRQYEMDIFTVITLVSAVGLATLVYNLGIDDILVDLRAAVARGDAVAHGANPPQMAQPIAAVAQRMNAPRGRAWRALFGAWFVLFCFFFYAMQVEVVQSHLELANGSVDDVSVAGILVENTLSMLPGLLVRVFVITFIVVYVLIFSWQVAGQWQAVLRR